MTGASQAPFGNRDDRGRTGQATLGARSRSTTTRTESDYELKQMADHKAELDAIQQESSGNST